MEFKVIKRNGNAVVPDGMFKLCGMENVKLISMVQLLSLIHISEPTRQAEISYAVFCLKKKKKT